MNKLICLFSLLFAGCALNSYDESPQKSDDRIYSDVTYAYHSENSTRKAKCYLPVLNEFGAIDKFTQITCKTHTKDKKLILMTTEQFDLFKDQNLIEDLDIDIDFLDENSNE